MNPFWYRTFPRLTHYARRIAGASYEREMELLPVLCDPARTGIDVGAKVGMYTYRIRDCSSDVVAFEPIPLFHDMLKAVFEGKRGRIEPVAVSNKPGKAVLRMPYDHGGTAQFGRSTIDAGNPLTHEVIARTEELEVETRTIDGYAFPSVGFIKVDVEGHELAVLDGAAATLAAQKPNLLVECNDDHQENAVAKLAQWLADHDYDAYFIDVEAKQPKPIAEYDRKTHWERHFVENFMCLHRSRPEMRERLAHQIATANMKPPAR